MMAMTTSDMDYITQAHLSRLIEAPYVRAMEFFNLVS